MNATALVWIRRELRLQDNLVLHAAVDSGLPVAVLYVLDPAILNSDRVGMPRLTFMAAALRSLDSELREHGSRLLVRAGDPYDVVPEIAQTIGAATVYVSHDYTPYARRRDETVFARLNAEGVSWEAVHDRLLIPPGTVKTNTGGIYTVFTPFKNKWTETSKPVDSPVETILRGVFHPLEGTDSLPVPTAESLGGSATFAIPPATEQAALERLQTFAARKIYAYNDTRNRLANPFDDPRNGTSSLSPYLRWGLLSLRQIRQAAADAYRGAPTDSTRASVTTWMNEIIWHEFYTNILYHFPHAQHRNWNPNYDAVIWRDAPEDLAAWQTGQTGYPVVDAAMRQLNATGWMHNRARMIVASFLTKHLLIDWRHGERYFMQKLLDGDTAVNNGGWQWAAGTGTDAQPYFRIFNPVSQSEKFDPDGTFIRRWVPELAGVDLKAVHAPWESASPPRGYAKPIVDHRYGRERALKAFSILKESS